MDIFRESLTPRPDCRARCYRVAEALAAHGVARTMAGLMESFAKCQNTAELAKNLSAVVKLPEGQIEATLLSERSLELYLKEAATVASEARANVNQAANALMELASSCEDGPGTVQAVDGDKQFSVQTCNALADPLFVTTN